MPNDGEQEERRHDVIAEMLAGGGAGALSTPDPLTGLVLGAAVPLASVAVKPLVRRADRAWRYLIQAAAPELTSEQVEAHLEEHPAKAGLILDATYAAARSEYEEKLEALGRALADGVLYSEGAKFEAEAHLVRTIARLEAPHVAVLKVVWERGNAADWHLEHDALLRAYREVLPSVLGELQMMGVITSRFVENDLRGLPETHYETTSFGASVLRRFGVERPAWVRQHERESAERMRAQRQGRDPEPGSDGS